MEPDVLELLELLRSGAIPRVSDLRAQGYSEDAIETVKAHINVKMIQSLCASTGKQIIRLAMPKQVWGA